VCGWSGTSRHVGRTGGRRAEYLEGKNSRNVDEEIVSIAEDSRELCQRLSGKA